ncbi:MAG: ABC transporter ATP-binding protein [Saprospiraceae bacterium]
MASPEKSSANYGLLRRILREASPYRGLLIISALLAIVSAPLAALRPRLVQAMVDDYIVKFDLDGLQKMTLVIAGVLVLEALVRYGFTYITNWLGQSVVRDLRDKVFAHITSLRLTYFDRTPIGTSTTRTINDIQTLNTVFTDGGIAIIADILVVFVVLGIMFSISWKLTMICLTTIPILIFASYIFKEKVKSAFQVVRTQISKMNAFLQERISGMAIVQVFNAEEQEAARFRTINREYTQANLNSIFYYAVFFPVVEILSAASLGLMVWWGARGVIGGEVSLGVLVAFPLYLNMLFRPIRTLADKFNTLQMGLVAAERVFTVLDRTDVIPDEGQLTPKHFEGNIKFDKVSFAYTEEEWVLKQVSFALEAKQTLAIVGSTGSGKSTIINLLSRFYEIQKGEISIDGKPIQEYKLDSLRSRIAIVLQDVFLFGGTVADNITLADPSISREQVIEASQMIGAHEFIMRLPDGYDHIVHERGATLSMGQRQLISFVRALVFNPDILVLDEATSSIDPESESVIQFAIEKLIEKRTSIVIAHRLATIRHADKILVLDKGKVVEFGNRDELLAIEGGHFRELWEMQYVEA